MLWFLILADLCKFKFLFVRHTRVPLFTIHHFFKFSNTFLPFCVNLYFCLLLRGLSGIVISIKPDARAGSRYRSLKFACPLSSSDDCTSALVSDFKSSEYKSCKTSPATSPVTSPATSPVTSGVTVP